MDELHQVYSLQRITSATYTQIKLQLKKTE